MRPGTGGCRLVLYSLLVSHWPALDVYFKKLNKTPKHQRHVDENLKLFLEMFESLELTYDTPVRSSGRRSCPSSNRLTNENIVSTSGEISRAFPVDQTRNDAWEEILSIPPEDCWTGGPDAHLFVYPRARQCDESSTSCGGQCLAGQPTNPPMEY